VKSEQSPSNADGKSAKGFSDFGADSADLAKSRIFGGSVWMVAMRWAIRLIGLVNTLVIVRILAPADFGIIAIAMIIMGLISVFAETGQRLAIIRHPNVTRELLDSAFTIQILVNLTLGALVFSAAPLAESYFREPRAVDVVRLLALAPVIAGFENIGTVAFRRELNFAKEFRYGIYQKLGSATLSISLAIIIGNYWALAIAILAGQLFSLALGYVMHPYRPWFSLRKVREIWGFSFWMLAGHVALYAQNSVDQIAVGGVVDSADLGKYAVAIDISAMPTEEMVGPATRALYPTFSRIAQDRAELREAYLSALSAIALICWSTAVGLALVARDFTAVVLGDQWLDLAPIIPWGALSAALLAASNSTLTAYQAMGYGKVFALQLWLRIALLTPLVFLASQSGSLEQVAEARFATALISTILLVVSLRRLMAVSATDVLLANWRPAVAATLMAAVISALGEVTSPLASSTRLALDVVVGVVVFAATDIGLWLIAGRPAGAERTTLAWLRVALQRLRAAES
jgi:O-antigen/teichoic acid export membrane protein